MSKIFGGSKTSNKAYAGLNTAFSPMYGFGQSGADSMQKLLGGDASGFNAYKSATGFDPLSEIGSRGITGNAAARGLLRSGSSGKALMNYGNTMQNQYAGDYMSKLLGLSNLGLNAGQVVSGAGQVTKENNGFGKFIGQIGAGIAASDRRLKKNINQIGTLPNGLGIYQFHYITGHGPYVGVMADEVKTIQPKALGPVIDGYATVNYKEVEGWVSAF